MVGISLCMIVKNEEANLKQCLEQISGYVDEIIIVDTGSTDRTREIALAFTDKVFDYPWNNDFSEARNYSISKSENEYILVLDSDEIVETIDILEIKRLINQNPHKIGRLLRRNEYSRKGKFFTYKERVNRLFSKNDYHYEGIIHEQLVPFQPMTIDTYHIPLSIRHSGYEGDLDTRKKKTQRNILLLKQAAQANPEDPYIIYQLGKSYYMEEDYQTACDYFSKALYFDLDPNLEYVQDMVESYGYCLINAEQYETALQLLGIYDEFSHSADFVFLIALILMNNGEFGKAIEEFHKAVQHKECKMEGVNDYLAFYNIGVIYQCLGDKQNALDSYKKCQNYDLALERLKEMAND